jgi:hypothetical protein
MTDAPPIHLTLHPTNESQFAGGRYLASRTLGPAGRLAFLIVPLVIAFAFGLGMTHQIGIALADGGLIALYTCLGGIAGVMITQTDWSRRYARLFAASALRKAPVPVILSAEGLSLQTRAPLPWSTLFQVSRWKDITLVQYSPVDAIVIRDADLPEGLTPADLAARIAGWQQ